jgi:hypothetical protein
MFVNNINSPFAFIEKGLKKPAGRQIQFVFFSGKMSFKKRGNGNCSCVGFESQSKCQTVENATIMTAAWKIQISRVLNYNNTNYNKRKILTEIL